MKLNSITVKNFRCFARETTLHFSDLTCLIGKNDIGKSTFIEALDAFFNGSIDKGDLSVDSRNSTVEITCTFDKVPEAIVWDSSTPTSPAAEGILNQHGQLEIRKEFNFSGSRKTEAIYLKAFYPEEEALSELLSMKNDTLKLLAEKLQVSTKEINVKKNPPLRQAIRNKVGGGRKMMNLKIEGSLKSEDNRKAVWKSISKLLPIFSLFKVDRTLDDKDADIQNPMKQAINEALSAEDVQQKLQEISDFVKEKSTAVADATIESLKDIDRSLAEKLKSDFSTDPSWNSVFKLTLLNDKDIPLNKRGSGVRRLVLLSFFQAQARLRKLEKDSPSIIYAIEEPETSQHPNHQLLLIQALIDLSEQHDVQIVFSSHNSNLVREIPLQSLRHIYLSEKDNPQIEYGIDIVTEEKNENTLQNIIKTLGVLPNPSDKVKLLVYVEGNNDVEALKKYSRLLNSQNRDIPNLMEIDCIGYVLTGGSTLKHYINNHYLSILGKPEVHIYDNDDVEYRKLVRQINENGNVQQVAFNTGKLELENYLHPDAISEAYFPDLPGMDLLLIEDNTNVPLEVAKKRHQLGMTKKSWDEMDKYDQKKKISSVKKFLNQQAVDHMTFERLKSRKGDRDMEQWFTVINKFIS